MRNVLTSVVTLLASASVLSAQSLEFYMDMGDKPKFDGIECLIDRTSENGTDVWSVTLTNNSSEVFQPVKAGVRLGIDTYMDEYPQWLDKYFPTLLYCSRTHFHGYLQKPTGQMLAIVSPDPVASWSIDYNVLDKGPRGFWGGHRICSVNIDLINALPLPAHHPQDLWKMDPGQALSWKFIMTEVDDPSEYEKKVYDVSGLPMIRVAQTSYSAGEEASFEVIGENPDVKVTDPDGKPLKVKSSRQGDSWLVRCRLGGPGLYDIEVSSGNFVTEGKLTVHRSWEWIMRRAREGVVKHKQRATSHVETWYGFHTAFLAARYFPDPSVDSLVNSRFDHLMKLLHGEDLKQPLYYEWRIQNTASTIGIFVDKYEAYGDEDALKTACALADWLIGYSQGSDGAYRKKGVTVYTSVIYIAKSILELYGAEKRYTDYLASNGRRSSFWEEAARRHYDSAKRAVDQLVAARGDFHTEGEMTFEDGMISCSALQMGYLALLQKDSTARKHYTDAMLTQLGCHDCLAQLKVPDARRRGGTMRYWEAQYDVHMMPNMFNSPHGWSAWRAYATYYAYLLTGDESWLLQTWNAIGAFSNLIDHRTGELRWAFVIDPYIRAKQMNEPVPGIDPDSLDFGNQNPTFYPHREFVFGEDYVPMISSWQNMNSQDNDVHEVFKCLGETFLTNAFVVERPSGEVVGYNCRVSRRGSRLTVIPDEVQITNLHVNIRNSYKVDFRGNEVEVPAGMTGFVVSSEPPVQVWY